MRNTTLVLITFSIPILDTTFVTIRRLMRGQSPMKGGKDHSTHTLFYKGLTDRQVAYVFLLMAIVSSLLALNVAKYVPVNSPTLILLWVYEVVLLVIIFKLIPRKNRGKITFKFI